MKTFFLEKAYSDENGNRVILGDNTTLNKVTVLFKGRNNTLIIDDNNQFLSSLAFEFTSDGAVCILGNVPTLKGKIRVGFNSFVAIGNKTTSTKPFYICCSEQTQLLIGDDCMLSTNNHIRTDDAHAIYDVETGERLNKSQDIVIGAHTWIAYAAKVYGGTRIGDGVVVGSGSIVKGVFPNNCTIAGSPARIVRRNVAWERPNLATKEPWIRNHANEITKTQMFWNKTDDYQKYPNLGNGFNKIYGLLQKYCFNSIWLPTNMPSASDVGSTDK